MLPPLPPVAPVGVQDVPAPARVDAFEAAMQAVATTGFANPDTVGRSLMAELNGFHARATEVQQAVAHNVAPAETPTWPGVSPDLQAVLSQVQENQRQSLGVMMQTYDFALEAEMVARAATTFTSSVNTLIKTQ